MDTRLTMKFVRLLFYIGGLFIFFTCAKDEEKVLFYQEENAKVYNKKYELISETDIYFPMDSSVSIDFGDIQYVEIDDSNSYLTIFDPTIPMLHIYDFESRKKLQSIRFPLQGPNGVGGNTSGMGHFLYALDTIMVYNIWTRRLFAFNTNAEKLFTIEFPAPDEIFFSARLGDSHPFRVNNLIFFPNTYQGVIGDQLIPSQNIPAFLVVDVENKKLNFLGTRSEVYDVGYNIAGDRSFNFGCYNPKTEKIIYSFRQDHYLYEMSVETGNNTKHFIGSEHFKVIDPLSDEFQKGAAIEDNINEREKIRRYILMHPNYKSIKYDRWNNVYYRFAFLPRTLESYSAAPYRLHPSIIIADENFNKIGETILDAKGYHSVAKLGDAFVTREGLCIPWRNNSEDVLTLKVFRVKAF